MTTPSTEWPDVHRVRVEDPGHHLRIGAHVRSGNVLLRPDLVDDLGRVAAGEALLLAEREQLRVADHAALGAAERQRHESALPGHPHRQGLDLVLGDARVIPDPALGRAAGHVVDDAVALEDADGAVVHHDGNRDADRLLAFREDPDEIRLDAERLADLSQLSASQLERILVKVRDRWLGGAHRMPLERARRTGTIALLTGYAREAREPWAPHLRSGFPITRRTYSPCGSRPPRGPRPVIPNAYRPGSRSRSRASMPTQLAVADAGRARAVERLELRGLLGPVDAPCDERQHDRVVVARRERGGGERDAEIAGLSTAGTTAAQPTRSVRAAPHDRPDGAGERRRRIWKRCRRDREATCFDAPGRSDSSPARPSP